MALNRYSSMTQQYGHSPILNYYLAEVAKLAKFAKCVTKILVSSPSKVYAPSFIQSITHPFMTSSQSHFLPW